MTQKSEKIFLISQFNEKHKTTANKSNNVQCQQKLSPVVVAGRWRQPKRNKNTETKPT